MIGRLLRKSDFERVLAVTPCSRSPHFAVHHLHAGPSSPAKPAKLRDAEELCTGDSQAAAVSVDNSLRGHWLGTVIPKRHAARSVTRNMLRRQVRAAVQRHETSLRPGLWLVRLRQPFAKTAFPAADSIAMRRAAAVELDRLLARAGQ
jgi:ribonuclease P protein component